MSILHPSDIRRILSVIIDPEINENIVDLGLIYGVNVNELGKIYILITFTSPTCPFSEEIISQVRELLENIEGVSEVEIEITFDPAWNREMMSEEAKLEHGLL